MQVDEIFEQAREYYLNQFRESRARFARDGRMTTAEVKFELQPDSILYRSLFCADFIESKPQTDGGQSHGIVELVPQTRLTFPVFGFEQGALYVRVSHLHWDRMNLTWSGPDLSDESFASWFGKWYDLDDVDYREGAEFQEKIHSAIKAPRSLWIDFGSAPVNALWALLGLIEQSGATVVHVFDETAEPRDPPPPLGPTP